MRVTIQGPNLSDQSRGQFHVHAAGCGDNKDYGFGGKYGGEEPGMTTDVETRQDVEDFVYGPDAGDFDRPYPGAWLSEFHFAPCVAGLPEVRDR